MTSDFPDSPPPRRASRRVFLRSVMHAGALVGIGAALGADSFDWRRLLDGYVRATRKNIVWVNGRRALLSARVYPGTYVRDAVFWGPLALNDPALGHECIRWFEESQLESGQIRTAVPLHPGEVAALQPQDDEGSLLFVIAADWLRRAGYVVDAGVIGRAYAWVETHVKDDLYVSPPGPFRTWADTVSADVPEAFAYNQGLLCLARRAMRSMGLGGVSEDDVRRAQDAYRDFDNGKYVRMGRFSRFADAQDTSAVFPEFISRLIYGESILSDAVVLRHVERITGNASVIVGWGRTAGIKVISGPDGEFLPPEWFSQPSLNQPGDYQNGGYWPMYVLVGLAMAYRISGDREYEKLIAMLVVREMGRDQRSKEIIRLMPDYIGNYDRNRVNYTWNALIKTACEWAGIA